MGENTLVISKSLRKGQDMKRLIYIVLTFTALFAMTACGNAQAPPKSVTESEMPKSDITQSLGAERDEISEETDPAEETFPQENEEQEETGMKMGIQIGDTIFTATLADNSSVDALKEFMADGPLTLNMSDYAGMEKGADLGVTLPQNNEQMNTQAGDIILYQGRTFVIYYDTNSWSLTPIGKIDNVDAGELRDALGAGDVTVTLYTFETGTARTIRCSNNN